MIVARGPGVSVNVDIKYIDESYVMDETFRGSSGQVRILKTTSDLARLNPWNHATDDGYFAIQANSLGTIPRSERRRVDLPF